MVGSMKVFAGVLLVVIAAVFVLSVTGVFDSFFDSQVKQERAYWDGRAELERQKGENTINEIKWWSWANSNRVDDAIRQMYAFLPVLVVILVVVAVVSLYMFRHEGIIALDQLRSTATDREIALSERRFTIAAIRHWQEQAAFWQAKAAEEQQLACTDTLEDRPRQLL